MGAVNTGNTPHRQYFYADTENDMDSIVPYVGDRLYLFSGEHKIWNGSMWVDYYAPNILIEEEKD